MVTLDPNYRPLTAAQRAAGIAAVLDTTLAGWEYIAQLLNAAAGLHPDAEMADSLRAAAAVAGGLRDALAAGDGGQGDYLRGLALMTDTELAVNLQVIASMTDTDPRMN